MPKLSTLVDAFTGASINTAVWSNITAGAATLDTVNDLVSLAVPTASGGVNTFGTNTLYDATGSSVYAQVGVAANGNGGTKSIMRVRLDANNAATVRVESGVFKQSVVSGGVTTSITLPTHDPHAHRWWRLREAGGSFYADTSPDGLNWTNLSSMAYSWNATAVTVRFESQASVTEVAGNATTIAHVNTTAGGAVNPGWPDVRDEWAPFWHANGGDSPLDRYVDLSGRTQGSNSVGRGRQYETDQVRAGEYSVTLANPDGALDPTNVAGPWAGSILPYSPYRKRAQWPPTRNMLTQVQATGGDLGGQPLGAIDGSNAGPSIFTDTDPGHGSFVTSASAWQGATVMQFTVASTATTGQSVLYTPQPGVAPGLTYTVQMYVRNVTASTSVQVAAFLKFATTTNAIAGQTIGSTVTLTGSATAAWTLVTVTATAPSTTALVYTGVRVVTAPGGTCSVQADGWQMEEAATASAWACPGTWYPMFGGFVERWPPSWTMGGTYGTSQPTVVDAFALLSQRQLLDALTMEINSRSPRFLYTLGDPQGSTSFTDAAGAFPAISATASKYGPGTVAAGTAITAASPAGVYTGSAGTVVTITNTSPGANSTSPASFLNLGAKGILGPQSPSFTRIIAFRYTGPTPAAKAELWSAIDQQPAGLLPNQLRLSIDSGGHTALLMSSINGGHLITDSTPVADSNWHLALFGGSSGSQFLSVDGTFTFYTPGSGSLLPTGIVTDVVGAYADSSLGYTTNYAFKGDVSYVGELPDTLSAAQCTTLYTAWRNAAAGESTDARYVRILRYAGYIGPISIQTGLTTSMGPAATSGQDAVSALQAVVDTENGAHFVAADGTVTFQSRAARYDETAPAYVFGERADLGEWPYEDCQLDYDSTHLGNVVTVTQESTGQVFSAQDATSITNYFPRTMSRTVNSTSALECQDAANYLLSRYKQPATRVSGVRLHPSANPAMWPVCLSLELGTRVRVMRRPQGAPPITVECFVESIAWGLDGGGEAFQTLQCSPADLTPYGIFAAWHSTLSLGVSVGATSITVDASQDTVNPLATQLAVGQLLVLGVGTPNAETVAVLAVGATSPGWTSAVITLTAATTKAHSALDYVSEPLPAGITDPTIFDAVSRFDSTAFAY